VTVTKVTNIHHYENCRTRGSLVEWFGSRISLLKVKDDVLSQRASASLLLVLTTVVGFGFFLLPRIPQPQAYHMFADRLELCPIGE
jgi:hypothetical protein